MRRLVSLALALVAASIPVRPVPAQGTPFDEGTFVVTRNGAVVGKEAFRIVRSGGKDQLYTSTAQCAFGDRRISPALSADRAGVPLLYRVEVKNGGEIEERLQATGRPGRLHAVLQTRTGESSKEYVVANGAVILDDDVYHQHFFVPLARRSGQVIVVVPRRNSQVVGRLEDRGTDKIRVDGRDVAAVHLVITLPDGSRDLWFDESGRLLKVAMPARGVIALREELPR
ncbi:MAG: hypothetical protein M3303_01575 [Gemmatimonadota bacterium]|nr:hypothetical protein [Gemmatimonadota bacterium]